MNDDKGPLPAENDEEFVTLRVYLNPLEAEWAHSILASAGICSFLPERSTSYLYNVGGGLRLQVPSSRAEEAEAFLTDWERERAEHPGEGLTSLDENAPDEELPEEIKDPGAIDAEEVCPYRAEDPPDPPLLCPKCGSEAITETSKPFYDIGNLLTDISERLSGRKWRRCTACGEVFKR